MKVAAIQHDIVWEDRDATLARVAPMVAGAVTDGAELVVLPEMFAVGFSMATPRLAEPPGGPTTAWLEQAAASHGVWIGGSLPERVAGAQRPNNTFVLAGPDGTVHRYAKRHPFGYGGEHRYYDAGDRAVTVVIDGVRLSLTICYDLRFADQFWALAPQTDAYLVVANWPAARRAHWKALLVARAIENQAYVVGVNRVGTAGAGRDVEHGGDTCIIDPMGEVLASAAGEEAVVSADIDPATVANIRARFPFLADRT